MGQFILFLLGLFAIGCVLYGISAGVQIIQRGIAYLAESARDGASHKSHLVAPLQPSTAKLSADTPTAQRGTAMQEAKASNPPLEASPMQKNINELRDIFTLFQQGALTQAEFESMKQYLLDGIKTAALQSN